MRKPKLQLFVSDEECSAIKEKGSQEKNCLQCGLFKNVKSPKMPVTGQGRLKVLIIAEAPGKTEDEENKQLVGSAGKFLRDYLEELDLDLDRDFWKTNAVCCRPFTKKDKTEANRAPTRKELRYCRQRFLDVIEDTRPNFIWLMGKSAIEAYYMDRFSDDEGTDLTPSRWRGLCIPDSYSKAWVIPMFHPSYAMRNEKDMLIQSQYKRDLDFAVSCFERHPPIFFNPYDKVEVLTKYDVIVEVLHDILQHPADRFSFDYETTGLKPFNDGHKIVCVAYCDHEDGAYAFPLQHPCFTESQQKILCSMWSNILQNKSKKVAHNLKFEDVWSQQILKTPVNNWEHCTMTTAHVLDNRSSFSGLKFQSFIRWGIEDYDKSMRSYIRSAKGTEFNDVMNAPLKDLLLYNGIDALLTLKLYHEQKKELTSSLKRANTFFRDGLVALADIQMNGIPANLSYYKKADKQLEKILADTKDDLLSSKDAKRFKKEKGREINISSDHDLRELFFKILKLPHTKETDGGQPSVDAEVLNSLDSDLARGLVKFSKLDKVKGTYLAQFLREIDDEGKIRPFFDLHRVDTYRSCVAKGTLVYVVRDFISNPNGVPIEEIKQGDYVYCFDNELNPAIRKVLWAGKTGHKKVVRIHWRGGRNYYGHLDVTPEHLIRLIDGRYVQARELLQDWRKSTDSKHAPKARTLSLRRCGDELYFSGHMKNGSGIFEHRIIYQHFIGDLTNDFSVHHKDGNHLNHDVSNLEKKTKSDHARIHCCFNDPKIREKNKKSVKQLREEGYYDQFIQRGSEKPNYLNLTKYTCLRLLAKNKGMFTSKVPYDFSVFKKYLQSHGIDPKIVKLRYDKFGKYISRKRLKELSILGIEKVRQLLGHNYYKLKRLYEFYGIEFNRKWGNQFGSFLPNNHVILDLEYLDEEIDVFDLEVEEFNNFFANEICVHNSSSAPNFQNIPTRDEEAKKYTRSGIIPSKGNLILGFDYKALEVAIAACISKDTVLMEYCADLSKDMHRDQAMILGRLPQDQVSEKLRFYAKNGFVFPEIYGSYFRSCAKGLWEVYNKEHIETTDKRFILDHLEDVGIIKNEKDYEGFENHVKDVEYEFWKRFKKLKKWQEGMWSNYEKEGEIHLPTGFVCKGYMSRNKIVNSPIQGSAFHCLLYALIHIHNEINRRGLKTKIIGQIHDNLLFDCDPSEKEEIMLISNRIATEQIREDWKWIIVPLVVSWEATEVDCSWYTQKKLKK